jgi:hypothetical protein
MYGEVMAAVMAAVLQRMYLVTGNLTYSGRRL